MAGDPVTMVWVRRQRLPQALDRWKVEMKALALLNLPPPHVNTPVSALYRGLEEVSHVEERMRRIRR